MSATPKAASTLQTTLDGLCRHPVRLRVAVAVAVASAWYAAAYRPLSSRIAAAQVQLREEGERLALADEVERLKAELGRFHERLPPRADPNEAIQYLLDGVRALPVRLVSMSPAPSKELGPYRTVSVRLKADGTYGNLDRLLRWVETNPRILRVEEISIGPSATQRRGVAAPASGDEAPRYEMDLTILGVIG